MVTKRHLCCALTAAVAVVSSLAGTAAADAPKPFEKRPQTPTVVHDPPGTMPVHGPRFAPVTVEFFCDPHNYSTKYAYRRLMDLAKRHPTRMRIVYRIYASRYRTFLAEALLEARAQGRFHEFAKALLARGSYTRKNQIPDLARKAGVDPAGIERAWKDKRHVPAIDASRSIRTRRGITSSRRMLVFNGLELASRSYNPSLDIFENAYDEARTRANALLARGVQLADLHARLLRDVEDARPPVPLGHGTVDGPRPHTRPKKPPVPKLAQGKVAYRGVHMRGPEDARVPIVLFCSMQSIWCGRLVNQLESVRTKFYPKHVRIVFRHLFDENDPGQPSARLAHEASMCAHDQDGFWRFFDQTYGHLRRRSRAAPLSIGELKSRAQLSGLDVAKFVSCLEAGKHAKALDKAVAASRAAGITKTPSLVIGGRVYQGTRTQRDLLGLIRQQLRSGLLERWAPARASDR